MRIETYVQWPCEDFTVVSIDNLTVSRQVIQEVQKIIRVEEIKIGVHIELNVLILSLNQGMIKYLCEFAKNT
jgi:hypothetical protein